ncbi:MAG: acyl-CoA desaturase [Chloroflexi bacterium]|nr:acyl-CoA desaturase [Chloroflexota bacterium]
MSSNDELQTLRRLILSELPPSALKGNPERALLLVPLLGLASFGIAGLATQSPPVWVAFLAALGLGALYASLMFLGHEISHSAVVRNRRLQDVLLVPCLFPFLISPHFWKIWHVRVHHGFFNMKGKDPDIFFGLENAANKVSKSPVKPLLDRLNPNFDNPVSLWFLFIWLSFFGQVVLWSVSHKVPGFNGLDRRIAALTSGAMLLGWIGIGWAAGPYTSLFVIVIPMLVANFCVVSYIITNHQLRPLSDERDPLETSMSVTSVRALDWLFHNFSYHIEHHLFPSMSPVYFPAIRRILRRTVPDRYLAPPHFQALKLIARTPRNYNDKGTFFDSRSGSEVPVTDITARLKILEQKMRPKEKAVIGGGS